MYQCETKTKIEHYSSSAGFQMVKHDQFCASIVFESIQSLLKWHWSVTHCVLDLSLVNEERLQKYLAPFVGEMGSLPRISEELRRNPLCTDWWPSSKSQTPERNTMDKKKHLMIVFCLNFSVAFILTVYSHFATERQDPSSGD